MHSLDLILTLAGGLGAALVFGFATQRAGLSPIVGYLVAGLLVGPHTPGFVADRHMAEQLAEVGIILLMFGVGLQFHIEELVAVWRVAVPGARGAEHRRDAARDGGRALFRLDAGRPASSLASASRSPAPSSSSACSADNRDLHTRAGHIAVGWLVVEDLLTVLVLVMMPAIFAATSAASSLAASLALALVKVARLTALVLVGGRRVVPWLLTQVATTRSRELFTLARAGARARHLGRVGAALRRLDGARRLPRRPGRRPIRVQRPRRVRSAADARRLRRAVLRVGRHAARSGVRRARSRCSSSPRSASCSSASRSSRSCSCRCGAIRSASALRIAVALAQIGEFSFIVAAARRRSSVSSRDDVRNTLVAAAIVSIAVNPLLYRAVAPIERWAAQRRPASAGRRRGAGRQPFARAIPAHRAVVIGYGPVGRTVARLLGENGVTPTIVDLNIETVQALRAEGVAAIYGDASASRHAGERRGAERRRRHPQRRRPAGAAERSSATAARAQSVDPHPGAHGLHPRDRRR